MNMGELEINSEIKSETENESNDEDCDIEDISSIFKKPKLLTNQQINSPEKPLINLSATLETSPHIALSSSDNTCVVYKLANDGLEQTATFDEHTDLISSLKFSEENLNLLYTCSNDGSVKLWDLRTNKSTVTFCDTTIETGSPGKVLNCFDLAPNQRLLAAGSNLFDGDAFILFWDMRTNKLLGGYWESHTDDITQVKFDKNDSDKLISGSTDGLINLYDLSESKESDALIDTLNTESSVETLQWLDFRNQTIIGCLTHTFDAQFWKVEDAQPYLHLKREDLAKSIKRRSADFIYTLDVHQGKTGPILLAGSNFKGNSCLRGITIDKIPKPYFDLSLSNRDIIRGSFFNKNNNILLTGGESGMLSVWSIN